MLPARVRKIGWKVNRLRGHLYNGGIKFPIDAKIMSETIMGVVEDGAYERDEVAAGVALCQPGERVLELGGGLGFISASLRKRTKAGPIVVCEANPALLPYMERVYSFNGLADIELRNCVVLPTRRQDGVEFFLREDMWASSLDAGWAPYLRSIRVPAIEWKSLVDEVRPTFLIMDIEGGEVDLLPMELGSIRRIVVELHPAIYGEEKAREILNDLIKRGFGVLKDWSRDNTWALERQN